MLTFCKEVNLSWLGRAGAREQTAWPHLLQSSASISHWPNPTGRGRRESPLMQSIQASLLGPRVGWRKIEMDLEGACISENDIILAFSWLMFGQLYNDRLEIIFPWNFEDFALCILASSIAFEKSKVIWFLSPGVKLAFSLWKLLGSSLQESPKLPSSIPNNLC